MKFLPKHPTRFHRCQQAIGKFRKECSVYSDLLPLLHYGELVNNGCGFSLWKTARWVPKPNWMMPIV
ncbi:unnamed protein product [Fusarium langsethiae]|nr:unnamed protein product [Fusarium langsethiae]GKU15522.1 unnamed protein product [Fusarium langsethiae]